MTDLDVEGLFWRPDRPDRKMAGHLQFGPTDGAILSIVEPFLNPDSLGVRFDDDGVRLLGIAGSHVLTLDQCHLIGGSQESNGMGQRRYRVFTVLSGAHFGIDEPLEFQLRYHAIEQLGTVGRTFRPECRLSSQRRLWKKPRTSESILRQSLR